MDIYTLIVLGHIIGAVLGAGGATLAEVNIARALKDGKVDPSERFLMHGTYTTIRVGMGLIVVSILGFIWYFASNDNLAALTSPKLLAKDIMFAAIFVNAILLTKRLVPLWFGSALSFTSWWGAVVLGAWRGVPYAFTELLIGYVVAIAVASLALEGIRRYYLR